MKIADLIQKYGASRYLSILRGRYLAGYYSREAFAIRAAAAYSTCGKPERAIALLETLNGKFHRPGQASLPGTFFSRSIGLPRPGCTLTMIARNESANITGALDSADTLFDEIVVCDTGSDDDTVKLALLYGSRVIHHTWKDDFAAARNAALEAGSCEWAFWMDADDRIDAASAHLLPELWKKNERKAFAVTVANPAGNTIAAEFLQVRLFPREKGVMFERRIHEQVMFSLKRLHIPVVKASGARIIHTGYRDPVAHRAKAERNLKLVKKELRSSPDDPSLLFALADSYHTAGYFEQAQETYRNLCDRKESFAENPDIFIQALVNAGTIELRNRNQREARRFFLLSLRLDRKRTESWHYLGRIAMAAGKEKNAAAYFLRAASAMPETRMTPVDNTRVRLESLYWLSEILLKLGLPEETENLLKSALVMYPMVPRFYTQIGRSLVMREDLRKAAEYFMQSINLCPSGNDEAYTGMAEIYKILGDNVAADRFLEKTSRKAA